MARLACCAILLLALQATLSAADVSIALIDAKAASYLQEQSSVRSEENVKDLAAIVTSLLNVPPVRSIDAAVSDQVAAVIRADPFSKPQAVLLLNVAGATQDLLPEAATARTFSGASEAAVVESLVSLAAARGVEHSLLDVGSLPGCGEACLEALLQDSLVALKLDANYTPGSSPLRGSLVVRPAPEAEPVTLQLARVPDRLLAVEAVSALQTSRNLAEDAARRKAAGVRGQQPQLVKRTLVSAQAVAEAYGAASPESAAAAALLRSLAQAVTARLSTAFDDRLVVVLTAFDALSAGSDTVGALGGAASIHAYVPARSLLQAGQPGSSTSYEDQFTAWIAMWAVAFLLLFFALAGCHCLRTMKFKQDSLLYGKNKAE